MTLHNLHIITKANQFVHIKKKMCNDLQGNINRNYIM